MKHVPTKFNIVKTKSVKPLFLYKFKLAAIFFREMGIKVWWSSRLQFFASLFTAYSNLKKPIPLHIGIPVP